MAILAAREKAVALAGELNCTIGKPRTITEGGLADMLGYMPQPSLNRRDIVQEGVATGDDSTTTLPKGQIEIRATVGVTFDLE